MKVNPDYIVEELKDSKIQNSFRDAAVNLAQVLASLSINMTDKDLAPIKEQITETCSFLGEMMLLTEPIIKEETVTPSPTPSKPTAKAEEEAEPKEDEVEEALRSIMEDMSPHDRAHLGDLLPSEEQYHIREEARKIFRVPANQNLIHEPNELNIELSQLSVQEIFEGANEYETAIAIVEAWRNHE